MNTTASLFFSALFAAYPAIDSDFRLEIRCLAPQWDTERPKPWPRAWYCLEPQYLKNAADACEHWSQDWDVYFGVLPRRDRTGRQEDVLLASCLYADVDGGDEGIPGAVRLIKDSGLDTPHIAVFSGGGVHCYWFLSDLVALPEHSDRETFKRTLRRLCIAIGGKSPEAHADTSACEVARVLRVPGTFNHKRQEEPRPVRMVRYSTSDGFVNCRGYDWWRSHLPLEPEPITPKKTVASYSPIGFISDGLLAWANRGYPEGQRHKDLIGAAAWLVRDCKLAKADALLLLTKKANASPGRRVVTTAEVEAMIQWA